MKCFAAIAAFACLVFANAQTMPPFTNCAPPSTDLTVNNFTVAPYSPCIGGEFCFTVTGTLNKPVIERAELTIVGYYLGRVIYTENRNFCELMAAQGQSCPVPVTSTSFTACMLGKPTYNGFPLPLKIQVRNGSGNVLFCQSCKFGGM
ncbi:hypothetical protein BGZ50_004967 [Haplosporangium sp. Z 11]|nr:hypothetical protein BGZ50_004967 [Haplosporangium sp. Z 11]